MAKILYTADGYPYIADGEEGNPFSQNVVPENANPLSALVQDAADAAATRQRNAVVAPVREPVQDDRSPIIQRLIDVTTGRNGEERFQFFPERMLRSGLTLFGDVAGGKYDIQPETPGMISDSDLARRDIANENIMERLMDTSGLVMGGGVPAVTRAAMESGPRAIAEFGSTARAPTPAAPAPMFYSPVENAIAKGQKSATPEQWLATLKNAQGIKQEELQWLGLEDYLKGQQGPVTRDQLADYVKSHKVEVRDALDTNKGQMEGDPYNISPDEIMDDWTLNMNGDSRVQREGNHWKVYAGEHEIGSAGNEAAAHKIRDQYESALQDFNNGDIDPLMDFAHEASFNSGEKMTAGRYAEYQLPGGKNYHELLLTLPPKGHGPSALKNSYDSAHWDEPNVLGHVRFNERTIDGKKTLFIEEVQSDWHQQGRKQGYREESDKAEKIKTRKSLSEVTDRLSKKYNELFEKKIKELKRQSGKPEDFDMRRRAANEVQGDPELVKLRREQQEAEAAHAKVAAKVSDAPFKKSWPELLMKRMMRYAAENGYDKIAWTPGHVQSKRWQGTGEHGHEVFYDEMLPNVVNKLGKQFGVKADKSPLEGAQKEHLSGEEAMDIIGIPRRRELGIPEGALSRRNWWDKATKGLRGRIIAEAKKVPIDVHSIDVPDTMKDVALGRGFPLFVGGRMFVPVDHDPYDDRGMSRKDQFLFGGGK